MGRYEKEDRTIFDFWRQVEITDKETGEKARGEGSSMREANRNAFEALKSGRDSWNAEYIPLTSMGSGGSSGGSGSSSGSSSYSSGGDYSGGSYSRSSSRSSHSNSPSSESSGLGWLVGGIIAAAFLGAVYFSALDAKKERLQREQRYSEQTLIRPQNSRAVQYRAKSSQTRHEIAKPDTAVLLDPGPPILGDGVHYTFDITSSSNNERVMRITYSGNLLRRLLRGERTYTIDRKKYPEVYENLDLNKDGEASMVEFIKHGIIFENKKIAEGVREGDIDSLVDKILKYTYGLCFTDRHVYYTLDCPVDAK